MSYAKTLPDTDWDFRLENTKTYTHCYHGYPAMMIPQIANRLIKYYGSDAQQLFDPYCGSGTSLVEANVNGINAVGTDLNPLARLIAEAKTALPEIEKIKSKIDFFSNLFFSSSFKCVEEEKANLPVFPNLHFWFSEEVIEKLSHIKRYIDEIEDRTVSLFFYVAFSETIREASYTRNSEFKLVRIPEAKRKSFSPDVYGIFLSKLQRNIRGLLEYSEIMQGVNAKTKILSFDTVKTVEPLKSSEIDLVVTSPPYGDSRTTVAYGQFSRLASQWLDLEEPNKVDNNLMGGKRYFSKIHEMGFEEVDSSIDKIRQIDEKRAIEVLSFYEDYYKSISNISKIIRDGAFCCYVVGNRIVKNTVLPTDEITKAFFEDNGLRHIDTFNRNIPNKRMPSKNSPTNKTGAKSATMSREFIVVMRKE
ncbi:hypothetical protein [Sedimentisphaera salicampi]|uniref:site-specific DNA-methyltransferase (cytosine-N(4)-specific) n=1 Tax=Sedimentisphaera salicampi TaxID=1941349 RepID=A0A1W6LKT9_9BACT|nr:hypothetical protein [Sedimentisphaera salicampi]ARN56363.1 DNA methylase [Sedimentisphaera salicampi]